MQSMLGSLRSSTRYVAPAFWRGQVANSLSIAAVQLSENGANIRQPLIAEVTRLIDAYAAGVLPGRKAMCMYGRWLLHGAVELSVASSTRHAWSILGIDITSFSRRYRASTGADTAERRPPAGRARCAGLPWRASKYNLSSHCAMCRQYLCNAVSPRVT